MTKIGPSAPTQRAWYQAISLGRLADQITRYCENWMKAATNSTASKASSTGRPGTTRSIARAASEATVSAKVACATITSSP